jgi:hypothetical protein
MSNQQTKKLDKFLEKKDIPKNIKEEVAKKKQLIEKNKSVKK